MFLFPVFLRPILPLSLGIGLFLPLHFMGQPTFQLSEHSRNAYQSIIELKLEKGLLEVKEEKKRDPQNLLPELLDNYADFLRLYFNEDPGDYEKFKLAWPRRLER
ncbi:MAG: hypothetical protein ACKO6K_07500, partial [Chitinophagaceae bacterium]